MERIRSPFLSFSDERRWEIYYSVLYGASYDEMAFKFGCDKFNIEQIFQSTKNHPIYSAMYIGETTAKLKYGIPKPSLMISSILLIEKQDETNFNFYFNDKKPFYINRWYKTRKRKELNQKINKFLNNIKYSQRNATLSGPEETKEQILPKCFELGQMIIDNIGKNMKHKKYFYEDFTYDFSMLMFLSNAKSYEILRQVFPLPCKQSLYNKYGKKLQDIKLDLTDVDRLSDMLQNYREMYQVPPDKFLPMTLGIDAFSFRSFLFCGMTNLKANKQKEPQISFQRDDKEVDCEEVDCEEEEEEIMYNYENDPVDMFNESIEIDGNMTYNNGFIFLGIPHDFLYPPKILHISLKENGSFDSSIQEIADSIKIILIENGFYAIIQSTDGDPGVSDAHNNFYDNFIKGKETNFALICENALMNLEKDPMNSIPDADPLHFLKNIRSRLINNNKIFTFYSDDSNYASLEDISSALNIGKITNDLSKMGKMRDSYAVHLFTFENVAKLIQKKCYSSACVLFPYSCIVSVLFSTRLSIGFRIFLIELSFYFFAILLDEFPTLAKNGIHQKGTESVTIAEAHYIKRILNSLVAFGVTLMFGDERLRTDALGTHLVENSIGIARQTSFDPRWERILTTYCHAEERKELAKKLGITIHVQNRINDGGCKIENDPRKKPDFDEIEKPEEWECNTIIELFQNMSHPEIRDAFADEVNKFAKQMLDISKFVDLREYSINETANCGIMARLITFKSEKK